jgi:glycine oxidase
VVAKSHKGASVDVLVVGGGIIGLTVAWRARQRGLTVSLLERDAIGAGASHVAAGMLAPVTEVEFEDARVRTLDLGLRSSRLWPSFAAELEEATGLRCGLRSAGTMMVARDADEARELERQIAFRESLGVGVVGLLPSAARRREPALAPTVRLAFEAPGDHSVDPRRAVQLLVQACLHAGVTVREGVGDVALHMDSPGNRIVGARLADGSVVAAGSVVVAAGAWSDLLSVPGQVPGVPVRPVKGQLLRLRDPAGPGLVNGAVRGTGVYIVPRDDGRYVVGATMEERGFDLQPTAGAAYELLRHAHDLVPGIAELELEEVCVGLRPGTPDNAPIIGRARHDGLVWACGHHRNGILLAPLTGELVAAILTESPRDPLLSLCDPLRFGVSAQPTAHDASRTGARTAAPDPAVPDPAATAPALA